MFNVIDEFIWECIVIRVERKLKVVDVVDVFFDFFILCGVFVYICFDNGLEFIVKVLRVWIVLVGVKMVYIMLGSFWENGYCESFNLKFRDELFNGEIFYMFKEVKIIIEVW